MRCRNADGGHRSVGYRGITSDPGPSDQGPAAKPKPAAPKLTTAQENAKDTAQNHLDLSGFSKKGLIKQLKFEGYKAADIDKALNTMKVDWNAEAKETAESYQEMSPMSKSGLIKQLKFEGYTDKQAAYGAKAVGLQQAGVSPSGRSVVEALLANRCIWPGRRIPAGRASWMPVRRRGGLRRRP